MIRALQTDSGIDLRAYLALLALNGIQHRVSEESGQQVVWVASEAEAAAASALFRDWQQAGRPGENTTSAQRPHTSFPTLDNVGRGLAPAFLRAPVSIVIITLCLLVALFSGGGARAEFVVPLFYPAFDLRGAFPLLSLLGQIDSPRIALQTVTPAFLHFGVIHLVFNTLWLWYLGSMIESLQSSWRYLGLILFSAFAGNTAQYLTSDSVNFGGMSGVVYGLIGYIWIWQTLRRRSRLRLPLSMIGFFLLALVLMEVFASAWIATAAHVGGLVSGMLVAALAALYDTITQSEYP